MYSLPAGYLAVTGETIQATQHNPPLEDIKDALTARLMRSGAAPMTGPLKIADGAVGAPGLAFNTAPTHGIYKTTDGWGVAVAGALVAEFKTAETVISNPFRAAKTVTFKDGGDIASASALTLGDGNVFNITGTTTITSIATKGIGTIVWLRFAAVLTLTHHSTDLILQTVANITTAAGDWCVMEEYAVGDWRMISYHRSTGSALAASLPRGYIDGCTLSNGSDATNDINIAAGVCRDSTNAVDIVVPALTGKQLDANWAAGSAAGMRNSAAGIANTTYWIYAVRTAASTTADIYAHTSTVEATVLTALQAETGGADYIYARCIGGIIRSGATILAFSQHGDDFLHSVHVRDVNNTGSHTTAQTVALTVPIGRKVTAKVIVGVAGTSVDTGTLVSSLDQADNAPSTGGTQGVTAGVQVNTGVRNHVSTTVLTNTSGQIRYRASDGGVDTIIITTGWFYDRGKDS